MIHRVLFVLLGFSCLGALTNISVMAQDGAEVIKVIKDDGAIQSLEIPKQSEPTFPQSSMSAGDLLKQMEAAMKDPVVKDAVAEDKVNKGAEIFVPKSSDDPIPKDAVPIFEPKNIEPVKAESVKFVPQKKTIKKVKKKIVKKAPKRKVIARQYTQTNAPPPLPRLKPAKPILSAKSYRSIDYANLPSGVAITGDVARRIALEYAPPARSVTVYENRKYKDRTVYQVTFKTENGMHDILIDAENGDVLKR